MTMKMKAATKAKAKPTKAKPTKAKAATRSARELSKAKVAMPSARVLSNAAKKLTTEERVALFEKLTGSRVPRDKRGRVTMTVAKLSAAIGKAAFASVSVPDVLSDKLRRTKKSADKGPSRIDTVVELLQQKGGTTADEIGKVVLQRHPLKRDGSEDTLKSAQNYGVHLTDSLNKGRIKKYESLKGRVQRGGKNGRYGIK